MPLYLVYNNNGDILSEKDQKNIEEMIKRWNYKLCAKTSFGLIFRTEDIKPAEDFIEELNKNGYKIRI
ncbi:MAG: hypothetical protein QXP39_02470 [Candidatus Aenigmatarchaeota archaeon]